MSLIVATPGGSAQFLSGAIVGDGVIANISGQQNNFTPPDGAGATLISLRMGVALSITGLVAAGAFTIRWLKNDSAVVCTLVDQSPASLAQNRFNCFGTNLALPAGASAGLIYNGLTTRWDLFTVCAASGGGGSAFTAFNQAADFPAAAGANADVTPVPAIGLISRLRVDTVAGVATITGILAGADGQPLLVTNTGAANDLTLAIENVGSVAANRLYGVADLTLPAHNSQWLLYDSTLARWVIA